MLSSKSLLILHISCLIFLAVVHLSEGGPTRAIVSLGPYSTIENGSLTVSGISAGGAMATQFHVAYSKDVNGVGIFAGIPYGCAKGTLSLALNCMSTPGLTTVSSLITRTSNYEKAGTIDPTSNMANDKVYVFHGSKDTTVRPGNGEHIVDYYKNYLTSSTNIKTEFTIEAEHCHPTDNFGTACNRENTQYYINDCDYQGSYQALNHFYGNLKPGSSYVESNLYQFDQKEFFNNRPSSASIDDTGYIYVPTECKDPTRLCKLHVAFHGCLQGAYRVGDVYVKNSGYLEVAEANAIIVMFPQVISTAVSNPNGCFDWWAYQDDEYETKNGDQMDGIWHMILKLGYTPA